MAEDSEKVAEVRCPGCKKLRPLSDLQGVAIEYDPEADPLMLCNACRTGHRTPQKYDPVDHLNLAERRIILAMMQGSPSLEAAGKSIGISKKRALSLLGTEARPVARAVYQACLVEAGLTTAHVSKRIYEATNAKKSQWNPKEQKFDSFIDHPTRLKAATTAAQHLAIAEAEKIQGGNVAIMVSVETNLNDPHASTLSRDTFVAESAIDVSPTPDVS